MKEKNERKKKELKKKSEKSERERDKEESIICHEYLANSFYSFQS